MVGRLLVPGRVLRDLGAVVTGVDADLATLRETLEYMERITLALGRGERTERLSGARAAHARVEAELSRLREERDVYVEDVNVAQARAEAAEADLQHQSERRAYWRNRAEAAEARCARLQQERDDAERFIAGLVWQSEHRNLHLGKQAIESLPAHYTLERRDGQYGISVALAGPGSEQSSLTESGSAGLPDTPADSQEDRA